MSTFISKLSLPVLAGVAGTLFLSYCIYFDHKRRSEPEFKKKLRDSEFKLTILCYLDLFD